MISEGTPRDGSKQTENTFSSFPLNKHPTTISNGQRTNINAHCKNRNTFHLPEITHYTIFFVCLNFYSSWVAKKKKMPKMSVLNHHQQQQPPGK